MRLKQSKWWLGLGLWNCLVVMAMGATYNSVQSNFRPNGLTRCDRVQTAGSDAAAQDFESKKANFLTIANTNLREGAAYAAASNAKLDPQRLYFFSDYAPRIYFLVDGGCYTNALGATIGAATLPNGQAPTGTSFSVFPSLNCGAGPCGSGSSTRTQSEPLKAGDFVQLPSVTAGQQLALMFMANLSSQGNPGATYYNDPDANADDMQHIVAFFPTSSRYIIVGFEDQNGGGDRDYNDSVVVIDVGEETSLLWRNSGSLPQ